MREVTLTTEGGKALVDFAVKRNLQYIHFDAGWYGFEYDKASDATTVTLDPRRNPKIDALNLKEVVAYAKQHGIGVMLYVNQRALQHSWMRYFLCINHGEFLELSLGLCR